MLLTKVGEWKQMQNVKNLKPLLLNVNLGSHFISISFKSSYSRMPANVILFQVDKLDSTSSPPAPLFLFHILFSLFYWDIIDT